MAHFHSQVGKLTETGLVHPHLPHPRRVIGSSSLAQKGGSRHPEHGIFPDMLAIIAQERRCKEKTERFCVAMDLRLYPTSLGDAAVC